VIERKEERIVRLEKLVADFKRAMFGSKSEKADPDQYQLALEDIETAIATVHAQDKAIDPPKAQPRKRNAKSPTKKDNSSSEHGLPFVNTMPIWFL
jgi:hypothetical protein